MKLSNRVYDTLKWVAQILLPALGTLYFALGQIWGFPYCEQIVGTVTAVDAFLGVILGLSSNAYDPYKSTKNMTVSIEDKAQIFESMRGDK